MLLQAIIHFRYQQREILLRQRATGTLRQTVVCDNLIKLA